jgi:hypothetical protein
MDRQAEASLGMRAQGSRSAATCGDGAGALWSARVPTQFSLALFRRVLLKFLKQKWSKCLIAKL